MPKKSSPLPKCFLNDLSPQELNNKLGEAWLGAFIKDDTILNPLERLPPDLSDNPELFYTWLMCQPDYFYFLIREILNMGSFPTQCLMLKELYTHKFPILIGCRGLAKTSSLAIYCLIRMITIPGRKIIITSGGFRQAKMVFNYMEEIWNKATLLRSCYNKHSDGIVHSNDAWSFRLGDSITYALPTGPDGSKLRGYRANDLIGEEFASMKKEIFETVMSGFLSVSSSPLEGMQRSAEKNIKKKLMIPVADKKMDEGVISNQLILCGTAYYTFNHFYEYFQKWRQIILSGGNQDQARKIFEEEDMPEDFNWKDYSIIRIPIELVPDGFMDMDQINRIRASASEDVYCREFAACFSGDSNGFFKRSLIESCTPSHTNIIKVNNKPAECKATLRGNSNSKYVIGVDPAYQGDNFAIVVIEKDGLSNKIVHVWTTQASEHKQRLKDGVIDENDYYHFCARKIRDLMKKFPCEAIGIDSQGGGKAIIEALGAPKEGELPIYEIIDPDKPKDSDYMQGQHIVHMINFSSKWIHDINHDVKKQMEQKTLLFPSIDSTSYVQAEYYDLNINNSLYDTLEDCIVEIEELKKELCSIIVTATPSGVARFTTPTDTQRKDRYSALLVAAHVSNIIGELKVRVSAEDVYNKKKSGNSMYTGNLDISSKLNDLYTSAYK